MNVFLWGVGEAAKNLLSMVDLELYDVRILGFIDNNPMKWGECGQYHVYAPSVLLNIKYDKIVILSDRYFDKIKEDIKYWYSVEESKIESKFYLLKLKMMYKYKSSEDSEILDILDYWKDNKLSVFNQYVNFGEEYSEVFWDYGENLPYILFEDKRMYFPYETEFDNYNDRKVVRDLMAEQQLSSPHLYLEGEHKIKDGDVVVDAGVREGNFILRYIDCISKAYLFESDQRWIRPLKKTFEKYREKVVLVDRYLGDKDIGDTIKLDTIVDEKIDFLKMDIEGAEIAALLGAKRVLERSEARCSICSYHSFGDEKRITSILEDYGYEVSTSRGYMVFICDNNIFKTADFRRGVVRAKKSSD